MSSYGINYKRRSFFPQLLRVLGGILVAALIAFLSYKSFFFVKELFFSREMYIGGYESRIQLIEDFDTLSLSLEDVPRGAKVTTYGFGKKIEVSDERFFRITYQTSTGETIEGYIDAKNIVTTYEEVVFEKEVYALSNTYMSSTDDFSSLKEDVKKGEKYSIIGWELNNDGSVDWYKLRSDLTIGYAAGKYFTSSEQNALLNYDVNDYFKSKDLLHLDYRPRTKNDFDDNPRVEEARSWYITYENLLTIDDFIEEAKKTNINTFVIDFKISEGIVYESEVAKEYAVETKNLTEYSKDYLIDIIKEINANGFYTIARIEVFKDQGYALSNPDATIKYHDGRDFTDDFDNLFINPNNKDSWAYNYLIAAEAAQIGFNEIMLDFVRFPNVKTSINENLNYELTSTKEEVIQNFSRYIYDQTSTHGVYVSSTTLGQVGYFAKSDSLMHGQQWHVMSNIFDYLYPKMFIENYASSYLSGRSPFIYQYDMIYLLNFEANELNMIISKAAEVRPIIQCYNNWGYYDWQNITNEQIERQIQAIYDNGNKGFVAWSEDDTIEKYLYEDRIKAFQVEYKKEAYSGSFQ